MYWIFGAGEIGKKVYGNLDPMSVAGFIDNDMGKVGKTYCHCKIYCLEDALIKIADDYDNNIIVIGSSFVYEIQKQLEEANAKNYIGFDDIPCVKKKKNYLFHIESKIKEIEQNLAEKRSGICNAPIRTVLLAGYNVDALNLGCRATSMALRDLLAKEVEIKDYLGRYDLLDLFDDVQGTIFEHIAQSIDTYTDDIQTLQNKIANVDAVVINGEGSFIFRNNPPRKDLYNFCLFMYLCVIMNKPFFLVNFMISGGYGQLIDNSQYTQALQCMIHAKKICVRDPNSFRLIKNKLPDAIYLPDALFSRFFYYEKLKQEGVVPIDALADKFGFAKQVDYIVVAGNSEAAYHQVSAVISYRKTIQYILDMVCKKDKLQLIIMECCPGDSVLKNLAEEFDLPFVPVKASVDEMAVVLQNARCFISGRYHPSILAMLGGTPCVFLGSNSHKTSSLQEVIDEDIIEFPALLDDVSCKQVIDRIEIVLKQANRDELKEKTYKLSRLSERLTDTLFEREIG